MSTHFSQRKTFRSSIHITLSGSRTRSIDGESATGELHVDPATKQLVTSALNKEKEREKTPEFVIKPRRQFVNDGETAKFKASFDGSPSTELTWSVNGKPVVADDRHKMTKDNDLHLLEIIKVTPDDQGTYVCKIENPAGSATADAELEVFVRPKPRSEKASAFLPPTVDFPLEDTEFADKEKNATLVCKFHNGIDGSAKWFKDGREVGTWQGKASYDGRTAKLVLREASKRVCGVYECIVKNSGGEAKTQALVSLLDPKVKPTAPKFTLTLCDQDLEQGEKLVLETKVEGLPRPSLKWYKDNEELGSSQDIRMEYKDGKGRLIVDNMDATDASKFTCVAQNVAGQDQTKADVVIKGSSELREPPIFTKELTDMEVNDGDRVEMSVEVKGTQPIDIIWVHNNREIPAGDPVCRMVHEGDVHKLVVPEVFPEDAGEYVCEAYNDYGDTDTFCRLNVHAEDKEEILDTVPRSPEFVVRPQKLHVATGTSAILKCQVDGEPLPSVQWSKGGHKLRHGNKYKISSIGDDHFLEILSTSHEDSGQYTCNLCNPSGSASTTTLLTVGEINHAKASAFRPVHRNRTQSSVLVNDNNVDLDSSEVSSLDSEPVRVTPLEQTSEPVRVTSLKQTGEPLRVTPLEQTNEPVRVTPLEQTSEPVRVTPLEQTNEPVRVTPLEQTSEPVRLRHLEQTNEPVRVTPLEQTSEPVRVTRLEQTSEPVRVTPLEQTNEPVRVTPLEQTSEPVRLTPLEQTGEQTHEQTCQKTWSPTVEKKGGVNQVDFRGILKNKSPIKRTTSGDLSLQKGLSETIVQPQASPNDTKPTKSVDSLSNGTIKPRNALSQTRRKFEVKSDSVPKSVQNESSGRRIVNQIGDKNLGKLYGRKVNQFLQKFENKETKPAVTDFRHVLKSRKERGAIHVKSVIARADARSVLKPDTGRHTNGVDTFKSVKLERLKSTEDILNLTKTKEKMSQLNSDKRPEFQTGLNDQSVKYGSQVVLECQVAGTPDPDVSWTVNKKEIKQSKFFDMVYERHIARLTIAEAFSEDEGEYCCRATNPAGHSTNSCNLQVQASSVASDSSDTNDEPFSPTATPPKIYDISPKEFCILRGGSIEFKASYTSVPAASVRWYKNKAEIKSGTRMKIDTGELFSTLVLSDIQAEDGGRYNIVVENALGSDTSYASLSVQDVPEKPVGEPWPSDVTLTSVTLSWYGPAYDGGCPVTNYRIEMCDAEDQEWNPVTSNCVHTTYVIRNLTPHTPYFFRIFAENKHGVSLPCQTSDVTVTSDRRPSALDRLTSIESDDVFTHETNEPLTPMFEYGIVSPLSPDEIPFEHREVELKSGRRFEDHYNCLQEVGKGKFGSVYKCEEKATAKIWAAKILKCRDADKKKIYLEVEIMNDLKHPKILMLWDVFEGPRKMILVMEYIGGGELFERVLDDDFDLTERDCIQFLRQILDAIHYMHSRNILHLDLKPENILCMKNESNKIKIIDFGLARYYKPGESVRVLFGTPEFIAPEVVNYDEIGFTTDMWSVGVICYVLLSGLSPFMGDSDAETLSNVTQGEWDFEDEGFDSVSEDGKEFIENLLIRDKKKRLTSQQAIDHKWLAQDAARMKNRRINTKNLKRFMARRKWQKTGNAIRALGRMTSLQKMFKRDTTSESVLSQASSSGNGSLSTSSSMSSIGSQGTLSDPDFNSLKVSESEETLWEETERSRSVSNTDGSSSTIVNSCDSVNERTDVNANTYNSKSLNSAFEENRLRFSNLNSGDVNTGVKPGNTSVCDSQPSKHRHHDIKNTIQGKRKSNCLEFSKKMVDSKAFPGDAVRFDVEYIENANIKLNWYFEEDVLEEGARHCIQQGKNSCSLIIKDVCEDDDGEYFCRIKNNNDTEICSAELIVYGAL